MFQSWWLIFQIEFAVIFGVFISSPNISGIISAVLEGALAVWIQLFHFLQSG